MNATMTISETKMTLEDVLAPLSKSDEGINVTHAGKIVMRILPPEKKPLTGKEIAECWDDMAHLSKENADELAMDLEEARAHLKMPDSECFMP